MSIWFLSTFIFPSWLSPFYSNLFGSVGFLTAGILGVKIFLEERKGGKGFKLFEDWEPKSKQNFLISIVISTIITFLMIAIFL